MLYNVLIYYWILRLIENYISNRNMPRPVTSSIKYSKVVCSEEGDYLTPFPFSHFQKTIDEDSKIERA